MRLSTFVFIVMLLVATVASAQVPLGSGISIKGTGGGGGSSTPAQTTDVDSDGLYEYVRFPQDFDGDGTAWQTCDCGGADGEAAAYNADYICGTFRTSDTNYTQVNYSAGDAAGNPAECRFHGQKIWDDTTDDINALYSLISEGTYIEFQAGTFVSKGGDVPTSEAGVHTSTQCWDSTAGTYTDVCATDPSTGSTMLEAYVPYSNMVVSGAGVDNNGDRDLVYTGTHFVTNNGPRTFWNTNTVQNGALHIGKSAVTYGGEQILEDSTFTTLDPSIVCLEDDFVNKTGAFTTSGLSDGALVEVTISHPSTHLKRVFAYVEERTATSCASGAGLEVILSGAGPLTQHYDRDFTEVGLSPPNTLFATEHQTFLGEDIVATNNNQVAVVRPERMTNNIRLSDMWFTHLDYVGAGGCEINDIETATCDNGILINGYSGFAHTTSNIGIIQSSAAFGSGQAINTVSSGEGHIWESNIFRFNQGGLIDVPQYGIFRGNIVSDNELIQNISFTETDGQDMFLIRQQGDNYVIEDNKFLRNTGPAGDDAGTDMWEHYQKVRFRTSIVEMLGFYGIARNNFFHMNQIGCINVAEGARELLIEGNTLACGAYSHHERFLGNQYTGAWPLIINSKGQAYADSTSGNIIVRNNRFNGWGGRVWQDNQGGIDTLGVIPRSQVALSGLNFNDDITTALDGDIYGTIHFDGNIFAASDDLWSHAVVMHTMRGLTESNQENGDPDANRLIFTGNHIEQGNLFGMVTISGASITGAVQGSDGDFDPDHNKDGIGLPQCGWNYDGINAVLDFTNRQVDGEQGTTTIDATNVGDLTATQINQQCESFLD
jgi:hypothetical protein